MSPERVGEQWVLPLGNVTQSEAELVAEIVERIQAAREARGRCGLPGDSLVRVSEAPGVPADVHAWIEARPPRKKAKKST